MNEDIESLLLQALANTNKDKEAVVFRTQRVSYGELSNKVSQTMTLLKEHGVGRGDRVAIWLKKSPESIFLLLATMGVGAAYIPIDPGAPLARVTTLVNDSEPALLITSEKNKERLSSSQQAAATVLYLSEAGTSYDLDVHVTQLQPSQPEIISKDDLAAILYTSGSTGVPKGVMLTHGNISNFVAWAAQALALQADDRFSSHAPFHFDLSTFDLFAAFHVGGTVCLLDEISVKFPGAVLKLLTEERITVWYSVPTALRMLVEHGRLESQPPLQLRLVLFAGEVFQPVALRPVMEAFPDARFFNLYGPTETNVCTFYEVPRPLPADVLVIPIGKPCPPLEVGIFDAAGESLPMGVSGEICVTGPGVMQGYWKQEAVTAGKRLKGRRDSYRTGDFGFLLADGNIMFTGRKDNQVKFRGFRIELLEIEAVISSHPDINEAVVMVVRDESDEQLLRLVVTAQPGVTKPADVDLARYIANKLPAYCVPDDVLWLEDMPRTSTGKVDRNYLLKM